MKDQSYDLKNCSYFNSLPHWIQESVWMSGVEITSQAQLYQLAKNLMQDQG